MTPIRGFFKRFLSPPGGSETTEDLRPRAPSDSPTSTRTAESSSDGDGGESRRRRGRRGGRGRGNGGEGQGEANGSAEGGRSGTDARRGSEPKAGRNGNGKPDNGKPDNGKAERRDYRWGRRVPDQEAHELVEQRLEQAQRRRRTNRRIGLDQPLPEDIAFRAASEGGDSSILPSRRRRPEGVRATERVILAGPRSLAGWSQRDKAPAALRGAEPAPEIEPPVPEFAEEPQAEEAPPPVRLPVSDAAIEAVASATDEEADATDGTSRRRRGRRGGRGRRRADEAVTGVAAIDEPEGAAEMVEEALGKDLEDILEDIEDTVTEPAAARAAADRGRRIDPGEFPPAFVSLGLDRRTLSLIARFGFEQPTPIQERAIPALMNGLDVVGVAQTGSGKTIAFGAPMMERLDVELREVQGLVMVPTRELAQQVLDVLTDLGKPWGIEAIGLLGGRRLDADFRALKAKPHVVVGTPGRVIDHLNRGTLSLRHVRYAVLDEADQMLDIGFMPDIRRILSRTPKRRQTALFSATMPSTIRRLVWQFMDDPETVSVDPELSTVESTDQLYFEVAQRDKVRGLRELIERELKGRTLVFCRTKRGVDQLERQLSKDGVRVGALHGDMEQRRRDRVVLDFRRGQLDILVATNVAARGLDIPEITHVVNYDVPQNVEEYVHRIGRTGRAGRAGKAITFTSEWDMQEFDAILREFGEQVHKEELHLYGPAEERRGA